MTLIKSCGQSIRLESSKQLTFYKIVLYEKKRQKIIFFLEKAFIPIIFVSIQPLIIYRCKDRVLFMQLFIQLNISSFQLG